MSLKASEWAWQQRPLTRDRNPSAAAKLVLVALADCADVDGTTWVRPSYLAGMTGLSERAVYDQITLLEDAGLLRREKVRTNGGPRRGFRLACGEHSDGDYPAPPPPVDNPPVETAPPRNQDCATAQNPLRHGAIAYMDEPSLNRQGSSARAHARAEDPRFAQLLDHLAALLAEPRYRRQLERASVRERRMLTEAAMPLLARGWTPDALARRLTRDAHKRIARVVPWLAQIASGEVQHEQSPLEAAAAHHAEREARQAAADAASAAELAAEHTRAHNTAADAFLAARTTLRNLVHAIDADAADAAEQELGEDAPGPVMAAAIRRHRRRLVWRRVPELVSAYLPPGVPPPTTDHPNPPDNGPQLALQAVPAGGETP